MRQVGLLVAVAFALANAPAWAWEIPPDNGTMNRATTAEILNQNDYSETSAYRQAVEFIDFTANGQRFTRWIS